MSIVQLEVTKTCYYDGRLRKPGAVVDYDTDHRGEDKDGNRTVMPSWGKLIKGTVAESDPEPEKTEFKEATLHGLADKPKPTVRKANTGKKVSRTKSKKK